MFKTKSTKAAANLVRRTKTVVLRVPAGRMALPGV